MKLSEAIAASEWKTAYRIAEVGKERWRIIVDAEGKATVSSPKQPARPAHPRFVRGFSDWLPAERATAEELR